MFANTAEAVKWVSSRRKTDYSLDHFREVCHSLGDPQDGLYIIHVAGTNGKGSTVNYLADLLMSQGFKVGTITSPQYLTYLDRIRINGRNIDEASFLEIVNENYDLFIQNGLSMYEMDYLIMCSYFLKENVDIAIVETGIGGRYDPTNVSEHTKLSIITSIGYDHMELLGDTLEKICYDKSGIIKENSDVLCGKLSGECLDIVRQEAAKKNAHVYVLDDFDVLSENRFRFHEREYILSSFASYQLHNASLAIYALELTARKKGFEIDYEKAAEALEKSLWHLRFEIVKENPRVILDGAHNTHGIEAMLKSFDRFFGSKCIIFSALKRKEYRKMAEMLKEHCDRLIITSFENGEAIGPKEMADYEVVEDYREAIAEAMISYDNILICGSLYFLSDVVLHVEFE